jgi:type II secretory pathway pseudopilin PulG
VLSFLALYSIFYARTAVRDDLRKQDITNIKHALEQYFNTHEFYVTSPENSQQLTCTQNSPDSWLFSDASPLLREQFIDAIPHDVRESKGHVYRYCVTSLSRGKATGFYLEAQLESKAPVGVFFDEDEERKFGFRVLKENGKRLYRVCGGQETQCEV